MIRAFGVCLAALALASCAHMRVDPAEDDGLSFAERRERLETLPAWEMRGRLAVTTDDGGFSGRFQWHQDAQSIALTVRAGPLGAGVLEVTGSPDEMIVRSRGETWTLGDPEVELSALLGWWVPVGSLHAWLLGLPDRAFAARTELGAGSALTQLEQRLWKLEYRSYQLADGILLPRRIDMNHDDLGLTLTVDVFNPVTSLN